MVDRDAKRVTFEVVDLAPKPAQGAESAQGGPQSAATAGLWSSESELGGFDPSHGTSSRGHATCLVCNQVADVAYIRSEGEAGRMWETPLAVIYDHTEAGKGYRPFTNQDEELFQEALGLLIEVDEEVPNEAIPLMSGVFNVPLYGLARWSELFNARQLLALMTFSRQARAAYEVMLAEGMDSERAKALTTYLSMVIDRLADYNYYALYLAQHWRKDQSYIWQTSSADGLGLYRT